MDHKVNKFIVGYLYNKIPNKSENEWNTATSISMYESLKDSICMMKHTSIDETSHERIHTIGFHMYKVQK